MREAILILLGISIKETIDAIKSLLDYKQGRLEERKEALLKSKPPKALIKGTAECHSELVQMEHRDMMRPLIRKIEKWIAFYKWLWVGMWLLITTGLFVSLYFIR